MKQVSVVISTYTADVSGVCSALYELGGMVVIHDPSGCNSTYNTHDEPRWYDMDSLVFISGLSEMDAIMGNDEKFIQDIIQAARELKPLFIALVRTPVPMMIGTDFEAIRDTLEEETGLQVFYFPTNGMHSYIQGVEMALEAAAERLVREPENSAVGENGNPPEKIPVNLIGVTPLDFSVNTTLSSVKDYLEKNGCEIISAIAMGSTPEKIARAGEAKVNLVVSSSGLLAAKKLEKRFGTPYVIGMPVGVFGETVLCAIKKASRTKVSGKVYGNHKGEHIGSIPAGSSEIYMIGEPVILQSMREAIFLEYGIYVRILCPLEVKEEVLSDACMLVEGEEEIRRMLKNAEAVIADPMYQPICPKGIKFFPLPHEAFSGRIYRRMIPDLTEVGFLRDFLENLQGYDKKPKNINFRREKNNDRPV